LATTCHEPSQGFSERHFAAIFEFLHHGSERLFVQFFARIASPGPRLDEMGSALYTSATRMIVPTGLEKWPAT
jgi:hypothetical protein